MNTPNEGIYKIENIEQVIDKGIELIRSAKKVVMANLFPFPATVFKDILEEKAAEGVMVLVKVYEPIELKGCHVVDHTYAYELEALSEPID